MASFKSYASPCTPSEAITIATEAARRYSTPFGALAKRRDSMRSLQMARQARRAPDLRPYCAALCDPRGREMPEEVLGLREFIPLVVQDWIKDGTPSPSAVTSLEWLVVSERLSLLCLQLEELSPVRARQQEQAFLRAVRLGSPWLAHAIDQSRLAVVSVRVNVSAQSACVQNLAKITAPNRRVAR